jgi:uncharacterized protein
MTRGQPFALAGPAGTLEAQIDRPTGEPAFRAVVSHPHPLYGGTMDNGVVMLASRALVAAGGETLRYNFRGVGRSAGTHDEGDGERLDLAAAIDAMAARQPVLPLILAGYSFGAVMTLELLTAGAVEPAGVLLIAPPVTLPHYQEVAWNLGSVPAVVLYGDRDGLTPPDVIQERAAGWSRKVRLEAIPGVGHDLGSFSAPRALETALDAAVASLVAAAAALQA